jgi:hypothetical protein
MGEAERADDGILFVLAAHKLASARWPETRDVATASTAYSHRWLIDSKICKAIKL